MRYTDLLDAWRRLDRSLFLDGDAKAFARIDSPLAIGWGQTISQPTLVLEMTRLLDPEDTSSVLEIGTGSGYQTALLARFSAHVTTVEFIPALAECAQARLAAQGFANIDFHIGDGSAGWPDNAPYDRIMVTAGAAVLPPALVGQLAPGGRMVIPVGPRHAQDLLLVTKTPDGTVQSEAVMKVVFVELVGPFGWNGEAVVK